MENDPEDLVPAGPIFRNGRPLQSGVEDLVPAGPIKRAAPVSTAYDVGRSAVSGGTEGTAGLIGLPTTIWNAAGNLPQPDLPEINLGPIKLFGKGPYTQAPDVAGILSRKASDITGGFTDYTPKTYLGKTVKEVGTLAPAAAAAALTGGASLGPTLMGGAVLPGVLGTAAGAGAEKFATMAGVDNPKSYGDVAKFATEVLTPMGAQRAVNAAFLKSGSAEAGALSRQKALQTLEEAGIPVTAGSFVDPRANVAALGRDMSYPATAAKLSEQGRAYTNFLLKKIGLPELGVGKNLADTIEVGREALGKDYGKIMSGVSVSPTKSNMSNLTQIVRNSGKNGIPGTDSLFARIKGYQKSGVPIDGQFLSEQRKLLSRNLTSPDPVVREYSKDMLTEFDNMLDDAFKASGDPDAMRRFADVRGKYRNLLAIEDAAFKSRNAGYEDIISPHYMNSQLVGQGKKSMVRGRRGDIGDVTEAAKMYLPKNLNTLKIPTGDPSILTKAMQAIGGSGLGYGIGEAILPGLGGQLGAPIGFGATQLGSAGLKAARGKIMGSDLVQNVMKNAALNPQAVGEKISPYFPAMAAYGDPREGRKRGGRVSSHDTAANQLVLAAERAKKGWSAQTEPLLNQSDETVVKALEVANRSI